MSIASANIVTASGRAGVYLNEINQEPKGTTVMDQKGRQILFIRGNDHIPEIPLDGYEPGDIKEIRERMAQELQCKSEVIDVRVTGISNKKAALRLLVIERGTSENIGQ